MSAAQYRFDAYIASAKRDAERVSVLAQQLRQAGVKVVLRDEIFLPGDSVIDRISTVIRESRTGLVVFSRAAEEDGWVQEEYRAFIRRSVELGRRFIPVLIDDVELPDLASNREPSDLRDSGAPDYERRVARLIAAIRTEEVGQVSMNAPAVADASAPQPPTDDSGGDGSAEADHRMLLANIESELGDAVAQAELPVNSLRRIWRAALGVLAPEPEVSLQGSRDLIREAADVVVPIGQPLAALTVAEFIAARSDPVIAKSIRRSIVKVAKRYGLSIPSPVVTSPTYEKGSVLVRLIPNSPGSKRYRVAVSTYMDLSGPADPMDWNENAQPIKAIKKSVGLVISKALKKADDMGGTTLIEFLLPRDLLREPVESWHLEKPVETLGSLYPVVIRDVEWPEFARGKSRVRWTHLLEAGPNEDRHIKRLTCAELLSAEQLRAWFELDMSRSVLVMPFQPSKSDGWAILDAAFASGISVVVWPRLQCSCKQDPETTCLGTNFGDDFIRRLNDERPGELPWLVKRLRNEATLPTAEAIHCGHEIVLLWQDPNRKIDELAPLVRPGDLKVAGGKP